MDVSTDIDVIQKRLESYMLNAAFFQKNFRPTQINVNSENNKETEAKFFFPKLHDSLFWCLFCMKSNYGKDVFQIEPHIVHREKQIKIDWIEPIRNQKDTLKAHKFDSLANIENQLANERAMGLSAFLSLCVVFQINVCVIRKKAFFNLNVNPDSNQFFFLKWCQGNKFGYKEGDLKEETKGLVEMEDILKPIKAASYYLLQDLVQLCQRFDLPVIHVETRKRKTKAELYQALVEYFA